MSLLKTVLVVDDSLVNRTILNKLLKDKYNVLMADSGITALEILGKNSKSISAVLLDIVMPGMDGYEVLRNMKNSSDLSQIPVLVTTGQNSDEAEIKALALGAQDFLTKPYNPRIILHRLANTISFREKAALINETERDKLTGVFNKEFFYKQAHQILIEHPSQKFDIIYSDIDNFKIVNDLFGTKTGDSVLRHVAQVMKSNINPDSVCGRIGGDTFAMLVPHTEKYSEAMFEAAIRDVNSLNIGVKLNIRYGIYIIDNIDLSLDVMCDRAAIASKSIKGKYGLTFACYDSKIREKLLNEQRITNCMEEALKEEQFVVYFQPKCELLTGQIAGAEALVRWIHPQFGFMNPGEFIPLFEKNGFITALDCYIWDKVCEYMAQRAKDGKPFLPISVNVSRADIYHPNLTKILLDTVQRHGLEPYQLHLEITESAYTQNPHQIISVVGHLKELGFIIEMDDFGTGYSSLNMLNELPIDILKLDMKFMQEDLFDKNKSILSFIISLANWLGLEVIAEGVESEYQADILHNMDCTYIQGYYFARPMPPEQFEAFAAEKGTMLIQKKPSVIPVTNFIPEVSGGTMLIVDDVELNRKVLAVNFENYYNIVEKADGVSALKYIQEHSDEISVILLDLIMPLMDGLTVMEHMMADEKLSKIPVIVISQIGEKFERRAFSMGAKDFISKPFDIDLIAHRINNVICASKFAAEIENKK